MPERAGDRPTACAGCGATGVALQMRNEWAGGGGLCARCVNADERTCTVLVAADPYNGGPCGEEAEGVRHEPTCSGHLDYHEVFLHEPVWRLSTDGWDPIDDATAFLRQRNVALDMLVKATGRSLGDVLREVRAAVVGHDEFSIVDQAASSGLGPAEGDVSDRR